MARWKCIIKRVMVIFVRQITLARILPLPLDESIFPLDFSLTLASRAATSKMYSREGTSDSIPSFSGDPFSGVLCAMFASLMFQGTTTHLKVEQGVKNSYDYSGTILFILTLELNSLQKRYVLISA